MTYILSLFEISNAYAQDAAPQGGSAFGAFLPLIIVFVVFYFIIFRPQQKQHKLRQKMISELKRGDEIVTNGGIYGTVNEIQDKTIQLQVAKGVLIKLDRNQIASINNPEGVVVK